MLKIEQDMYTIAKGLLQMEQKCRDKYLPENIIDADSTNNVAIIFFNKYNEIKRFFNSHGLDFSDDTSEEAKNDNPVGVLTLNYIIELYKRALEKFGETQKSILEAKGYYSKRSLMIYLAESITSDAPYIEQRPLYDERTLISIQTSWEEYCALCLELYSFNFEEKIVSIVTEYLSASLLQSDIAAAIRPTLNIPPENEIAGCVHNIFSTINETLTYDSVPVLSIRFEKIIQHLTILGLSNGATVLMENFPNLA